MVKTALLFIVIAIAAIAGIAAVQSPDFRVARTSQFSAPSSLVFQHVNDLHKWQAWSPWAKLDPQAKISYEGPDSGTGAAFSWVSTSDKVGEGKMTIIESQPGTLVKFRLDFVRPFTGTNTATFTFEPSGTQSIVTWSMEGQKNFLMKLVGLFMDCDKMVGEQFEQGLANLKAIVEP